MHNRIPGIDKLTEVERAQFFTLRRRADSGKAKHQHRVQLLALYRKMMDPRADREGVQDANS